GLGNQIEGVLEAGQKVVIIEDLVSTGKSSLEAVAAVRAAGGEVIGLCALFTYGFPEATAAFEAAEVPLVTISNYNALITIAQEQGIVAESDLASLEQWRLQPSTWGQ